MRRGMGQDVQHGNAYYDSVTGRYLGGSAWMDVWCKSWAGATFDPVCAVPTPAQVRARVLAELQTTSAPQSAIDAAMKAGDAAIAADQKARPGDYSDQCAAAVSPGFASTLGPQLTAVLFPMDADCNPKTPWLLIAGTVIAGMALFNFIGGRR